MSLLYRLTIFIVILAQLGAFYLHNYPILKGCEFPTPTSSLNATPPSGPFHTRIRRLLGQEPSNSSSKAPLRLLVLADPQLEGDTSIWDSDQLTFSQRLNQLWFNLRTYTHSWPQFFSDAIKGLFSISTYEIQARFRAWRKIVDLYGNDYYLATIYKSVKRHSDPTHLTVLGDLLGSQWIDDVEFKRRASRYWHRVFHDGTRVPDRIMRAPSTEVLGADPLWKSRIVNLAGNHDIGYAGDITEELVDRFESAFGRTNWEITFELPKENVLDARKMPRLRLVVLNSMNIDTPAKDTNIQKETYEFINEVISRSDEVADRSVGTIVLTHIPLYKKAGICVDGPLFNFHSKDGTLQEQNHLSQHGSKNILEGIYGMSPSMEADFSGLGRHGIILNGHDHEGCDTWHFVPRDEETPVEWRTWQAVRWSNSSDVRSHAENPGIREVTVRSMMGEYGGNAGLLSAWWQVDGDDPSNGEWRFEYASCSLGVQHIWWVTQVLTIIGYTLVALSCGLWLSRWSRPETKTLKRKID